jgi:hypothetical protein
VHKIQELLASQPDLSFSLDLHQNQLGPGALTQVTLLQPFFHFPFPWNSKSYQKHIFLVCRKKEKRSEAAMVVYKHVKVQLSDVALFDSGHHLLMVRLNPPE